MASTAKAGQMARQRARERRIALDAGTKARNDRIENWTSAVFTGMEERDRAFHAAAVAEDAMADGLIGMAGEGLTTSEIAELCEMTVGEINKLTKQRRAAIREESLAPLREVKLGRTAPSPSRDTDIGATDA